jgi:hypothetical protein
MQEPKWTGARAVARCSFGTTGVISCPPLHDRLCECRMAIHIGRREFIRGAAAWLLAVRAQQPP